MTAEKKYQREKIKAEFSEIMVVSMNHELRTPLNAIEQSLLLIQPYLNPRGIKYFDIISTSVQFLIYLVADTLDFAIIQQGKFCLNFEKIDIAKLVLEIIMITRVQVVLKKKVIFKHLLIEGFSKIIESDGQRIK